MSDTVAVVPEVRLTMPARAEGVGVVRQALAGMADALAFNAAVVADMKMAVTEACTNVVVHAYEGDEGTLEVEMLADEADADDRRPRLGHRHPAAAAPPRGPGPRARPAADRRALGLLRAPRLHQLRRRGPHDLHRRPLGRSRRREPGHRHDRRRRPLGPEGRSAGLGRLSASAAAPRTLAYAACRSASSSRMRPRRPSARDSIWRTRSGVMPSWRPISRSGVGSPPAMP